MGAVYVIRSCPLNIKEGITPIEDVVTPVHSFQSIIWFCKYISVCEAGVQTDVDTEEADEAELHDMLSKLHGSVSLLIGLHILYWFVLT